GGAAGVGPCRWWAHRWAGGRGRRPYPGTARSGPGHGRCVVIDVGYPWPGCEEWKDAWPESSLDDSVRRWSRETPDKPAIVDPRLPKPITFSALDDLADRLVDGLVGAGARPGDVIAVQLPNWWEFVALYVAVTRAGMVLCPVSPAYRRSELCHILTTSGAVILVVPG